MSVSASAEFGADGLYVPFRGVGRYPGPVGTVDLEVTVTGDATGGSCILSANLSYVTFGFHPLLAVTRVHTIDLTATIQNVRILFDNAANERLANDYQEVVVPVEQGSNNNHANLTHIGVPIEPIRVGGTVVAAVWNNSDGIAFALHVFAIVYDMEALARRPGNGVIDVLAGGIR